MLEIEAKYFDQKVNDLVKTDLGKFVLIKEENIYGTFETMTDALQSGYEKFKAQPFFVRQILPAQQPMNFANNYLFA